MADEQERRSQPGRWKYAFWTQLGKPPVCPPGAAGQRLARGFLDDLDRVREQYDEEGMVPWTRNEQSALSRLYRKWEARAKGEDPVFNQYGYPPQRGPRHPRGW
jgi:hypothetical protein